MTKEDLERKIVKMKMANDTSGRDPTTAPGLANEIRRWGPSENSQILARWGKVIEGAVFRGDVQFFRDIANEVASWRPKIRKSRSHQEGKAKTKYAPVRARNEKDPLLTIVESEYEKSILEATGCYWGEFNPDQPARKVISKADLKKRVEKEYGKSIDKQSWTKLLKESGLRLIPSSPSGRKKGEHSG